VDALVHAVESYISKNASVATEPFAIRAIELIGDGLKPAYDDGDDLDAREVMQIGATMAMVSTMNALLGLCHAMAMPLCALYHIPHGQACGLVLPSVLAFNAKVQKEKVAHIFKAMGYIDKDAGGDALTSDCFERLRAMLNEIGVMTKLSDHGYKEAHMETIVKGTMNSVQTQFNPRTPNETDIAGIVRQVI